MARRLRERRARQKRRAKDKRHCDGKRRFATEEDAQPSLQYIKAYDFVDNARGCEAVIYACDLCGGFHVGHKKLRSTD